MEAGAASRDVLDAAVELGISLIDTADAYGSGAVEELIGSTLHPYPDGLVLATKGGVVHEGPGRWRPDGRPEHLRAACEASLRRLRTDRIELYQLHAVDPAVPLEESLGALAELRDEGKIDRLGLSNVSVEELAVARRLLPIASVQNRYSLARRESEPVLAACAAAGIAFLPWRPLEGAHAASAVAQRLDATAPQVALAWLLARDPCVIPIPGTAVRAHLAENSRAEELRLDPANLAALDALDA